ALWCCCTASTDPASRDERVHTVCDIATSAGTMDNRLVALLGTYYQTMHGGPALIDARCASVTIALQSTPGGPNIILCANKDGPEAKYCPRDFFFGPGPIVRVVGVLGRTEIHGQGSYRFVGNSLHVTEIKAIRKASASNLASVAVTPNNRWRVP